MQILKCWPDPTRQKPANSWPDPTCGSIRLVDNSGPNYLSLPRLTTTSTLSTLERLSKSTLRFLSFNDTPHIHLTIIRSVLSKLCGFAFLIAQVSVPYVNTHWTQTLYIFPIYVAWCTSSQGRIQQFQIEGPDEKWNS